MLEKRRRPKWQAPERPVLWAVTCGFGARAGAAPRGSGRRYQKVLRSRSRTRDAAFPHYGPACEPSRRPNRDLVLAIPSRPVPDPRSVRGIRYGMRGLLTVAICAVLAGGRASTAMGECLHTTRVGENRHGVGYVPTPRNRACASSSPA